MKNLLSLSLSAAITISGFGHAAAQTQIISTVAGNGVFYTPMCDVGDGSPATTSFANEIPSLAFDASGNMLIVDKECHNIREVNTSGILSTIIGNGVFGFGDGGPATAGNINWPTYILNDGSGNFYISDQGEGRIRKINTAGILSTVAGTVYGGIPSGDGGPATAAVLNAPMGMAMDPAGNLLIVDAARVRKVNTTTGIITTIAGGGTGGDGIPATAASLGTGYDVGGVAVDAAGNIYISGNDRIRKVNTSGIISTIAGGGSVLGDGGPATAAMLSYPVDMKFDTHGNLFIADQHNERIRMINTSGIISTVAGTGVPGYSGDGGAATAAKLSAPAGLAFDAAGNLYIADDSNSVVRKLSPNLTLAVTPVTAAMQHIDLFPNPTTGSLNITGSLNSTGDQNVALEVTNLLGQVVYKNTIAVQHGIISTQVQLNGIPSGIYLLHLAGESENEVLRFSVNK